jgi:hypothetical protein
MMKFINAAICTAFMFLLVACQNNNSVLKYKIDSLQKENVYLRFQMTANKLQPQLLDTLKIYSADHQLITTHSLSYFLENPHEFKGQTIGLAIHYVDNTAGQSLKDRVNDIASFSTFDGTNNGVIKVKIRPNMFVPVIHYKDLVLLSFFCQEGSLDEGNIAVKIGPGENNIPEGVIMSSKENNP